MINFSDIFGDDKERQRRKKDSAPIDFSSLDSHPLKKEFPVEKKETPDISTFKIQRANSQEEREIEELYKRSLSLAEKIFTSEIAVSDIKELHKLIEILVNFLRTTNQMFFEYIFGRLPSKADFMPLNLVNVCILALELGIELGYSDAELINLGMGAFLHDIGMKQLTDLISQPRHLTNLERQRIHKHPLAGKEQLEFLQVDIEPLVLEIVNQEHERRDGSGYPSGLKENDINEYAQIVGLVDVYEALTHSRPYRNSYPPLEAMKIILRERNLFDARIIKAFLERVGLYPKGTFVELNTKEVAQVLTQNRGMPSCPLIRVVYDYKGKKLDTIKEIDLSKNAKIYILRSL